MILPNSKTLNTIQRELNNELLVYNLDSNKIYNLNQTASAVFRVCDGNTSLETLKHQTGFSDDLIFFTLDELKRNNLIEAEYQSKFTGLTRREIVKRVGLASMTVLPIITGIIAPTATHAQSECVAPDDSQSFPNSPPCAGSDFRCATAFCNSKCCSGSLRLINWDATFITCTC